MFKILKLDWTGKQHSGIVDARNTAKLTFECKEHLKVTRTLGKLRFRPGRFFIIVLLEVTRGF